MINIIRSPEIPESLKDERIKTYLKEFADYEDKEEKEDIDKPKLPISYRSKELLTAFDNDFFSKCYLTEEKFESSWEMDVEHFIPQIEKPELIYEWTNLYPASHKANMRKFKKTLEGGYLDPCNPDDDVEKEIIYHISAGGLEPKFNAKNENNIKAKNTVKLLDLLHNGKKQDKDALKKTMQLRGIIHKKYDKIHKLIIKYQKFRNEKNEAKLKLNTLKDPEIIEKYKKKIDKNEHEEEQIKFRLEILLSKKSAFTMLCRSMSSVRDALDESFFD